MGKKGSKGNKSGGDFWDEEYAEPESVPFGTEDGSEASTPAPEDGQPAEEEGGDFLSSIRNSKKKKQDKKDEEKSKPKEAPKILSKKEKEKLKKEAEKQKKKEQAAKKKEQQQNKKEQIKEANKKNAAAGGSASASPSTSSAATPEPEAPSEEKSKAPAKKGKKVPAGLAALKRQLELKKQLEEEQRRLEEEEEERLREEEKKIAEEEAQKEALRLAKKEKERQKKEQLKAEGKLLTKKQKEEKKLQERRRQQLLQGNVSVPGLAGSSDEQPKPKKVVYSKKKSSKPKTFTQKQEAKPVQKDEKKDEKKDQGSDEELVEDWEKMALDDDEPVAESWDAVSDDEKTNGDAVDESTEDKEAERLAKEAEELRAKQEAERKAKEEAERKALEQSKKAALQNKKAPAQKASVEKELRSPICCILGHVDTGKTKLLDKIRQTNVQGGEAGGITQQIGATYFPVESIKQKTQVMAQYEKQTFDVPGLLIIDTPGHESFTNLRSRGSSLCNIAILVIDIMHGLEQQTLESLRLLRDRKAPFVVALNKIDRLFDWESKPNNSFRDSFARQGKSVQSEFESRYEQIKLALAEQGLNSELYYQNKNMSKYVSIVPTSAVTGEGVPDLLWLLLELTQKRMSKQLMYLSKVEATILEVKVVEGFGYTIDVVLSNGVLREGDRIVLCGLNGPIATNIRALLTPPPSRELRIKSEYVHHKEVKAALGVKIAANDLEKAVAGSRLVVVGEDDDEDEIMEEVMDDLTGLLDSVDTSGRGVVVQASTLGSLEALLDFLKDMKIPVMSIGLGPVYKRDVMKATTMLDKAPEYAVMLCFDVKVDKEAEQYAMEQNIKIFNADIIYHLFDAFTAYQKELLEERRKAYMEYAVLPCVLKTIQIINKRNPMIIGVDVIEGAVRLGTPICAVRHDPETKQPNIMVLGKVVSLEVNHKSLDSVKKGQTAAGVAMRLENPSSAQPTWGRHVDESDNLYSLISRKSIDTLKDPAFRDTISKEDWLLIKKLKPIFDIK